MTQPILRSLLPLMVIGVQFTAAEQATTSPTLSLNAPVGSSVTLKIVSKFRNTLEKDEVSAVPGAQVDPSQLEKARQSAAQKLKNPSEEQIISGTISGKIIGRDPAGKTTMAYAIKQFIPVPNKAPFVMKMQMQQTIAPDGKVSIQKMQSNLPQLQKLLDTMNDDDLQRMITQSGSNLSGGYGLALKPGTVRQNKFVLPSDTSLKLILSTIPDEDVRKVMQDAQSTASTTTITTTYQGKNAQGQYMVLSTQSLKPWQVTLAPKKVNGHVLSMKVEALNQEIKQNYTYRPNGLPAAAKQITNTRLRLIFIADGVQEESIQNTVQEITMSAQ